MEERQLLEYCWKHKLFSGEMRTTNGNLVEVIDQGLFNKAGGPTFFNVKIRVGGVLWVGNQICLVDSADWYSNGYQSDKRYDNVVLVVCENVSSVPKTLSDREVCMVEVNVPENVRRNFEVLMSEKGIVHCHHHVNEFTSNLSRHAWLAAMQTESLEEEANRIKRCFDDCRDWQSALDSQLFRAFGFGINDDIMSSIYRSIPRSFLSSHHVDDLFQLEAVILGQAGLLELETVKEEYQKDALNEGYFAKLRNEWLYLVNKYAMYRPPRYEWKPYGQGRSVKPHVLLSSLANLIYQQKHTVKNVIGVKDEKGLSELVTTHATPYWQMHTEFGKMTEKSDRNLTKDRKRRIVMDCHIPFLFAYGRKMDDEDLCDLAFDMMEDTGSYKTHETAWFERFCIKPDNASDVVALCHLKNWYCDNRDCMRCRFGYEFVKKHEYAKK